MRPPAERVTYSDPLAVPLAAVTHESLDPVAFKVDRGILVALTGRFPATGATPVARALQFVSSHASLFSRTGAAPALKLRRTTSEVLGDRTIDVVVLRQQFDGIDVYAAELSILLHGNAVIAVGGVMLPEVPRVGTRPRLTAESAIRALGSAGVSDKPITQPRLAIYDRRVFGKSATEERPRLVWQLATESTLALVDAHDGSMVTLEAREHGAIALEVYDNADDDRETYNSDDGGCQIASCFGETDRLVSWMTGVYGYYKTTHGWIGYEGDDGGHEVFINSSQGTFYQKGIDEEFHFQTGYTLLDVVGHEFTHGVIDHRSELEYHFESGALDESFADLMGNLIQGESFPTARVGEGLPGAPSGLRDMCDPSTRGQPETFWDFAYLPDTKAGDYGGVHVNNGIPNFAWCKTAQLLRLKGNSDSQLRGKMGAVAWMLMGSLPSDATMYITAAFAMTDMQALYGGIGANPWGHACLVWDAWNQVGVAVNGPITVQCIAGADSDIDGIINTSDNCTYVVNPSQVDADHDGLGDVCDPDADGDGVPNTSDNCNLPNPTQQDSDGDGLGDTCEDMDHDGIDNDDDNCLEVPNAGQEDTDADFVGDACEPDNDGDGIIDDHDNCQFVAATSTADTDGDGLGNPCDPCPAGDDVVIAWTAGVNQPPIHLAPQPILADTDGDGTPDGCDPSPTTFWIDGVLATATTTLAVGNSAEVKGTALVNEVGGADDGTDAAPRGIQIVPCRRGECRAYSERVPVVIDVRGLAPGVEAILVDDRGRAVDRVRKDGNLRFAPRGGRVYQLVFVSRAGVDLPVDVDVTVSGGES
jgi:hypothetical protein